jgi:hypothetical protein
MWTDMSEIVRPTRDGIHGREFISTEVDLSGREPFLQIPIAPGDQGVSIPIPILFDAQTENPIALKAICEASRHLHTYAILPIEKIQSLHGEHIIPLITSGHFPKLHFIPHLVETTPEWYRQTKEQFPDSKILLRTDFETTDLLDLYKQGARLFHLTADSHGRSSNGHFILDLIRKVHTEFLMGECRNEVTLIGSGGIIAAEHVPKAILCGLDAVALDTVLLVAMQGHFKDNKIILPNNLSIEWGAQRLQNLIGAWRDQLLEILGAMGLREVRRMRGEIGRALFQKELEREAFTGIEGYGP